MDDAHLQSNGLYEWLDTEGYAPTKCTLNPATRKLTQRISDGKPIDQSDNGCNAEWDTQICGCALERPPPTKPLGMCDHWANTPPGKLPRRALEDCTNTDHHVWKG